MPCALEALTVIKTSVYPDLPFLVTTPDYMAGALCTAQGLRSLLHNSCSHILLATADTLVSPHLFLHLPRAILGVQPTLTSFTVSRMWNPLWWTLLSTPTSEQACLMKLTRRNSWSYPCYLLHKIRTAISLRHLSLILSLLEGKTDCPPSRVLVQARPEQQLPLLQGWLLSILKIMVLTKENVASQALLSMLFASIYVTASRASLAFILPSRPLCGMPKNMDSHSCNSLVQS